MRQNHPDYCAGLGKLEKYNRRTWERWLLPLRRNQARRPRRSLKISTEKQAKPTIIRRVFLLETRMNMTVEMYEQAVLKAMKEVGLFNQNLIKLLFETLPVDKPIRSQSHG